MENIKDKFSNQKVVTIVLVVVSLYVFFLKWATISIPALLGIIVGWVVAVFVLRILVSFIIKKIKKTEAVNKTVALNIALTIYLLIFISVFLFNNSTGTKNIQPPITDTSLINTGVVVDQNIPEITGYVVDNSNLLDTLAEGMLISKLKRHADNGNGQITVLTIKTLNGLSIEEYAIQVENKRQTEKVGQDKEIIIIVATDERKVRIQVGNNVKVTDEQAGQILDNTMVPLLKKADWVGAINAGVNELIMLTSK